MDHPRRLLGIAGSLREGSLNRALLEAAKALLPEGCALETFSLDEVPMYRSELDTDGARPAPVTALKAAIDGADGVVFATPEYNYGIPGVLKNAIDWASRPAYRSVLRDKPVTIVGASPGGVGTARAQGALKTVLLGTGAAILPAGEYLLANAKQRFEGGTLVDEGSRDRLRDHLALFDTWCQALDRFGMNADRGSRA